ncbi:MAG: hypothetical protein ACREFP_10980 [Acetobacteraceae bacterium]
MSGRSPHRQRPAILAGLILLAQGCPEGFRHFGGSVQAFLASLAPLVAFPLVGGLLIATSGRPAEGLMSFLETICVLLAQPVISEALAERWGRGDQWLRYATAFNWCQWLIPLLAIALLAMGGLLLSFGMPSGLIAPLLLTGIICYALWLQWFLARRGLDISALQAVALVVLVNLGTAILLLFPRLLASFG